MCHVTCVCYDGLIAVRGCVEEAVSSTLPHRNAFFVVLIVTHRGVLQRQPAWRLSARDADMDLFVDSVQRWLTRDAAQSIRTACGSMDIYMHQGRASVHFEENEMVGRTAREELLATLKKVK